MLNIYATITFSSAGSDSSTSPTGYTIAYSGAQSTIYDNTKSITFKVNDDKYYIPLNRQDSSVSDITSVVTSAAPSDISVSGFSNNARGYFTSGGNVGIVVKVEMQNSSGTTLSTKYDYLVASPTHIYEDARANITISSVGSDSSSAPTGYTRAGSATVYSSTTNSITFKVNGKNYYIGLTIR